MNSAARRKMAAMLSEFAGRNRIGGIWLRLNPDGCCTQMVSGSGEGGNAGGLVLGFNLGRGASLLVQTDGRSPLERTGREMRAMIPSLERMLHEN